MVSVYEQIIFYWHNDLIRHCFGNQGSHSFKKHFGSEFLGMQANDIWIEVILS
jgi:hypothetical protein